MGPSPVLVVGMVGMMGIISLTVIRIVTLVVTRNRSGVSTSQIQQMDDRLSRIEQAIDAMAVEVERISEGQRFTTKLLSERSSERVGRA